MARLLDASLSIQPQDGMDEYEELLSALNAVSLREFAALRELHSLEKKQSLAAGENEIQAASRYWDKFKALCAAKHGIPDRMFSAFMAKLERTGLYLRITGVYFDYSGDVGRTTPLFERLLEFVQRTSQEDNHPCGGGAVPHGSIVDETK